MDREFQGACACVAGDLAGAQAIAARPGFVRATAVANKGSSSLVSAAREPPDTIGTP